MLFADAEERLFAIAALTTHDRADLTETSEAAAICTGAIHKASNAERAPSMRIGRMRRVYAPRPQGPKDDR